MADRKSTGATFRRENKEGKYTKKIKSKKRLDQLTHRSPSSNSGSSSGGSSSGGSTNTYTGGSGGGGYGAQTNRVLQDRGVRPKKPERQEPFKPIARSSSDNDGGTRYSGRFSNNYTGGSGAGGYGAQTRRDIDSGRLIRRTPRDNSSSGSGAGSGSVFARRHTNNINSDVNTHEYSDWRKSQRQNQKEQNARARLMEAASRRVDRARADADRESRTLGEQIPGRKNYREHNLEKSFQKELETSEPKWHETSRKSGYYSAGGDLIGGRQYYVKEGKKWREAKYEEWKRQNDHDQKEEEKYRRLAATDPKYKNDPRANWGDYGSLERIGDTVSGAIESGVQNIWYGLNNNNSINHRTMASVEDAADKLKIAAARKNGGEKAARAMEKKLAEQREKEKADRFKGKMRDLNAIDREASKGDAKMEMAKHGTKVLAKFGLETLGALTGMGVDIAAGALTGGGAIPAMVVGAAGGAARYADKDKYGRSKTMMALRSGGVDAAEKQQEENRRYAALSGAIEGLTEKIFAVGAPMQKLVGKGAITGERLANGMAKKLAKGKAGQNLVNAFTKAGMSMTGEGLEEVIAGVLNPIAEKMTIEKDKDIDWGQTMSDALHDGLIGAAIGGVFGGAEVINQKRQGKFIRESAGEDKLIQAGLRSNEGTKAHQLATDLLKKSEEGQQMNDYEALNMNNYLNESYEEEFEKVKTASRKSNEELKAKFGEDGLEKAKNEGSVKKQARFRMQLRDDEDALNNERSVIAREEKREIAKDIQSANPEISDEDLAQEVERQYEAKENKVAESMSDEEVRKRIEDDLDDGTSNTENVKYYEDVAYKARDIIQDKLQANYQKNIEEEAEERKEEIRQRLYDEQPELTDQEVEEAVEQQYSQEADLPDEIPELSEEYKEAAFAIADIAVGEADLHDYSLFSDHDPVAREALQEALGVELPEGNEATRDALIDLNMKNRQDAVEIAINEKVTAQVKQQLGDDTKALFNTAMRKHNVNPDRYATAFEVFRYYYNAGHVGSLSYDKVPVPSIAKGVLPKEFLEFAYKAGRRAGLTTVNEEGEIEGQTQQEINEKNVRKAKQKKKGNFTDNTTEKFRSSLKAKDKKQLDAVTDILKRLSEVWKVNIALEDPSNLSNGYYKNNTIHVNANLEDILMDTFLHEFMHHMEKVAPKEWKAYADFVAQRMNEEKPGSFEEAINKRMRIYSYSKDTELESREDARREVIADSTRALFEDKDFPKELARHDASLAAKIADVIKKIIEQIKQVISDIKLPKGWREDAADKLALRERQRQEFAALWKSMDDLEALKDRWVAAAEAQMENESSSMGGLQYMLTIIGGKDVTEPSLRDQIKSAKSELDALPVIPFESIDTSKMSPDDYLKAVYESWKKYGEYIDTLNYGRVELNNASLIRDGFNHIKHDLESQGAFPVVPKVIKRGIQIALVKNHDGRGYDTLTIGARVGTDAEPKYMAVVLRKTKGSRYYMHSIIMPDGKVIESSSQKNKRGISPGSIRNTDGDPGTTLASNNKISRLSKESKRQYSLNESDEAYMKAVESGDMETAQRMVDEAAERAMPDSILREGMAADNGEREYGKLIKMYHGSGAKGFYKFILDDGALGKGAYFSSSFAEAVDYAISSSEGIEENDDYDYEWSGETWDYGSISEELEDQGYVRTFYLDIRNENDYDDSNYGNGEIIAVARKREQIKSADPVTYDDNGNVIPLSERFNPESEDVRYSLREDEEYMKAVESGDMETAQRMVDEAAERAGYTIKAYHGSPKGDITIFRDWTYFTEDEKYADRYRQGSDDSRVYESYLKVTKPFDTRNDKEREIFENEYYGQYSRTPLQESGLPDWTDGYDLVDMFEENDYDYDAIILDEGADPTENGDVSERGESIVVRSSNQIKSAAPVTYDDAGNVIPLSERFNPESKDVRFSLKEPVERVRDLIAVHNMNPDNLRSAFDLGGFPMPSIAVTKADMGHDKYGDISLLFHSDTIDPSKSRYNEVYGGDAYTPTFPSIEKKISNDVLVRVEDRLRNALGMEGYGYEIKRGFRFPSLDADNVRNAISYRTPYEAYKDDPAFKLAYLKEKTGKNIRIPMVEAKLHNEGEDFWKWLASRMPAITFDDAMGSVEEVMRHEPAIREAVRDYKKQEYSKFGKKPALMNTLMKHYNEPFGYAQVHNYLVYLAEYLENGIPNEVDLDALNSKLDKRIDARGYKKWFDDLFDGIIEKEGIRNSKDLFTPSGNRRSWEALHDSITLENVVKEMRQNLAAGAAAMFGANPRGAAQKKYRSLDDIRSDEGRLRKLPEGEYDNEMSEAISKMAEVTGSIAEHNRRNSYEFFGALDVGTYIAEVLNKTKSRDGIKRALERDYMLDVYDYEMDDLMEAIHAIAEVPTGYFEAKPRRAVGFDEVKAAVVPKTLDKDIKDELTRRGVNVREYDPNKEGARAKAVNDAAEEQDVKFSVRWDKHVYDSVSLSPERLDNLIREYAQPGNMKGNYSKAWIATIDPRDFLKLTVSDYTLDTWTLGSKNAWGQEVRPLNRKDLKNEIQMPFLEINSSESNSVIGHEGRHRMLALWRAGYTNIPVVIIDTSNKESKEMMRDIDLWSQDFGKGPVNDWDMDGSGAMVEAFDLIPINEKHRAAIEETYVEDTRVQFSVNERTVDDFKKAGHRLTPADEDYINAVNSALAMEDTDHIGYLRSMREVSKMVDRAARKAGYSTKAYHGTDAEPFNEFKRDYIANGRLHGDGFYFSPLEEVAEQYQRSAFDEPRSFYLKTNNVDYTDLKDNDLAARDSKVFDDIDDASRFFDFKEKQYERNGQGISRFRPSVDMTEDGKYQVSYTTVAAFDNGLILVATEPEYIKSADPITLDENGYVIPLSERFNEETRDVRFSLNENSLGRQLSPGQQRYFKNSQARDIDGRLAVVYHSTDKGGFTIFDPGYSDDGISLFFTDNRTMSEGYSRYGQGQDIDPYSIGYPVPGEKGIADVKTLSDVVKYFNDELDEEMRDNFVMFISVDSDPDDVDAEERTYSSTPIYDWEKPLDEFFADYEVVPDYVTASFYDAYGNMLGSVERWENKSIEEFDRQISNELKDTVKYYNNEAYDADDSREMSGTYAAYLNLEDPLVIDAKGSNWNEIRDPGFERYEVELDVDEDGYETFFVERDGNMAELKTFDAEDFIDKYGEEAAEAVREETGGFSGAVYDMYLFDGAFHDPEVEGYPMEGNTRFWCETAMDMGCDGVIFRNLYDNGAFGSGMESGDVYVAFSSNQVKDIRNEDPTEDPDIRYSVKEKDVLEHFGIKREKNEIGESVNHSLRESIEDYEDENKKLRKQVEKLRSEMKLSHGTILADKDATRIARHLLELPGYLGGLTLNETNKRLKKIYTLLADDETLEEGIEETMDLAADIVANSGEYNEDADIEFKSLSDYLRSTPIYVSDEEQGDLGGGGKEEYTNWRKSMFGVLNIRKKGTPQAIGIDQFMIELRELFPGAVPSFDPSNNSIDQFKQVLDYREEMKKSIYSYYNPEEPLYGKGMTADVAGIIFKEMETAKPGMTFADRKKKEKERAVQRTKDKAEKKISKLNTEKREALDKLKEEYKEKLQKLREEKNASTEQKLRMRMQKEQERDRKRRERVSRKKLRASIERDAKQLSDMLLKPTDKKHLPKGYDKAVAALLSGLDFETVNTDAWTKKYGEPSQRVMNLRSLREEYAKIVNSETSEIEASDYMMMLIDALSHKVDGQRLSDLDTKTLSEVRTVVKAIKHQIQNINRAFSDGIKQNISELGEATIDYMKELDDQSITGGAVGKARDFISVSNAKPIDFFDRVGSPLQDVFNEILKGEDAHIRNVKDAIEFIQDIKDRFPGKKPFEKWSGEKAETKTFTLKDGSEIELTPAQIMSLYALNKREQARKHMFASGIVVAPVSRNMKNKLKKKMFGSQLMKTHVHVTYEDVLKITGSMTNGQKMVADRILYFLNNQCAAWGNETSMKLYGYEAFREKNYFPIKSSEMFLNESTQEKGDAVSKLKNTGFTKATQEFADNPIVIDDFFRVTTGHINTMSMYNAFVPAITDFERVYNYNNRSGRGIESSVKQMMNQKYGNEVTKYINTLLQDLNTQYNRDQAGLTIADTLLRRWKQVKIGANARVLLQQPTAITRAQVYIDYKYLAKGIAAVPFDKSKKVHKRMWETCPIAYWKHLGFAQTDISRDMMDILMSEESLWNKATFGIYGAADDITWTRIFAAVEAETRDKHPELAEGSQEWKDHVNERFRYIVDRTQVVDSTLHRSQLMRSKQWYMKSLTSFMAEPTTQINMWMTMIKTARDQIKAGDKGAAARTMTRFGQNYLISMITLSLTASLISAMRESYMGDDDDDDDKDKTFLESWIKDYAVDDFTANINILNQLPWTKDVISLINGYDVERADMSLIADAVDSIKRFKEYFDKNGDVKFSWKKLLTDAVTDCSALFGVPAGNIERDAMALRKAFYRYMKDSDYAHFKADAFELNPKKNKSTFIEYYLNALESGDKETTKEIKTFLNENNIKQEDIDRIVNSRLNKEINKAIEDKDPAKMKETIRKYKKTYNYTNDAVSKKIRNYFNDEIKKAVEKGDIKELDKITKKQAEYGVKKSDIESSVSYWTNRNYKIAIEKGDIKKQKAYDKLLRRSGMSAKEVYLNRGNQYIGYYDMLIYNAGSNAKRHKLAREVANMFPDMTGENYILDFVGTTKSKTNIENWKQRKWTKAQISALKYRD